MTSETTGISSMPEYFNELPIEEPEQIGGGGTDAPWTVFRFSFLDREGYERRIRVGCTARSVVLASICELGVFGGQVLPFQGAATMSVDNVVPHDDGTVIIRGGIGWGSDLNARLHILVAPDVP